MNAIPFVDAHFHLWRLDRIAYPWLTPPFSNDGPNGSVAAIARDYAPADYRADVAGWNMVGAVHVEAGAEPASALAETDWLAELAADERLPTAVVAHVPLDAPDAAELLARQAARPNVRGIRQIVNWHADPRRSYTPADVTGDPRWRAGFELLGEHGLSFDLQCYPAQMRGIAPLVAARPEIPVVVNHCGMPVLSDPDGRAEWRDGLTALAEASNVAVKLSGLGFIDRAWRDDDMLELLEEVVGIFGPSRCLFASDAPTDVLFAPLDRCLGVLARLATGRSDEEARDMWGRNADRIYRLDLAL